MGTMPGLDRASDPGKGLGGHVIRNNVIRWAFDAVVASGANVEFYDNRLEYIRDNSFDDGVWFNWHIYHNTFKQGGPEMVSYDWGNGGHIYFYGNVAVWNEKDTTNGISGYAIWKLPWVGNIQSPQDKLDAYLTHPLYIVHNSIDGYPQWVSSYRNEHHLHHFNNACTFSRWNIMGDFDFSPAADNHLDFDCFTAVLEPFLQSSKLELSGVNASPEFIDPVVGNLRLNSTSPCIDKGRTVPRFTQHFSGKAPDIGAYERGSDGTSRLVAGPPFKTLITPADSGLGSGLGYAEKPRISRTRVQGNELSVFFTWDLQVSSLRKAGISLHNGEKRMDITDLQFKSPSELVIVASEPLVASKGVLLTFDPLPKGTNGETFTYWAAHLTPVDMNR